MGFIVILYKFILYRFIPSCIEAFLTVDFNLYLPVSPRTTSPQIRFFYEFQSFLHHTNQFFLIILYAVFLKNPENNFEIKDHISWNPFDGSGRTCNTGITQYNVLRLPFQITPIINRKIVNLIPRFLGKNCIPYDNPCRCGVCPRVFVCPKNPTYRTCRPSASAGRGLTGKILSSLFILYKCTVFIFLLNWNQVCKVLL